MFYKFSRINEYVLSSFSTVQHIMTFYVKNKKKVDFLKYAKVSQVFETEILLDSRVNIFIMNFASSTMFHL